MVYRRVGNSGLKLPAVSLGLWHNFGESGDFENSRNILFKAFDLGITHFDLANNYGLPAGSAEINAGKIIASDFKNYRDELIISSKAGYYMWPGPYGEWGSRKYLIASCDQSLRRLGLDYVDIFYHHRPDPDTPMEETMAALKFIVDSGRAIYAGISNYNAEQTLLALEIAGRIGLPLIINQVRYSMLDRWIEDELIETAEKEGIGLIVFSPLAQGLLTDKYLNGIPEDSRAAGPEGFLRKEHITEEVISKVIALNKIASGRNQSMAQLALAWVLRNKAVTSALIGASRPEQVEANVKTINNLDFSKEELAEIEAVLS